MKVQRLTLSLLVVGSLTLLSGTVHADARGVGLGVAAGLAYSPNEVDDKGGAGKIDVGSSFGWGFFVDIPLLETFYISPAALIYELDLGDGPKPVTDIDLNFKFIVPIGPIRAGAGLTAGLTVAEQDYQTHVGALGYFSFNLVSNLDAFVLGQYKKMMRDDGNIDDIHIYGGGMFRF